MAFDIKKERIRFRRQDDGSIRWEIPELGSSDFAATPTSALSAVRRRVGELASGSLIAELKAKIEVKRNELTNLLCELVDLEDAEPSTLPELIAEQVSYLERALLLLEPDAKFGIYTVKLVGVLDVGDEDADGDLDYKVSLGW